MYVNSDTFSAPVNNDRSWRDINKTEISCSSYTDLHIFQLDFQNQKCKKWVLIFDSRFLKAMNKIFLIKLNFFYLFKGSINVRLYSRAEGPITLISKTVVSPWSKTWKQCVPDTIKFYPPIEWIAIVKNIIWGQLLYPL